MLELFEIESSTVLAVYPSLDEALRDIREEIGVGGRSVARTWALGERLADGQIICLATGDALAERALAPSVRAAS